MCSTATIDTTRDLSAATQQLAVDGVVLLPGLCAAEISEHILSVSQRRAADVKAALGDSEIGIGSAAGYAEIVQRSPGRWDVPITPAEFGISDREMPWWPLVAAILGEDAEHSFSDVVFSEPGSPAQCWHTDSPHLASEHLPAHAVNVMMALHDVSMAMGPTEIACGSHVLTNHLRNTSLVRDELIYQNAGTTPARLVRGTDDPVPDSIAPAMTAGSCLVFDDRILHRGLANRSNQTRSVAYFSYRKKGYAENTHFESRRSVYDEGN